jgi:hypothetical protein
MREAGQAERGIGSGVGMEMIECCAKFLEKTCQGKLSLLNEHQLYVNFIVWSL